MKIKVASLFSGCGGLDFGFHADPHFEIIFALDSDKGACGSYQNYFGHTPECGDIRKVQTIPDCDVMLGGFPCQGFSIANSKRNKGDKRNGLYLELVRLLKGTNPKCFVFENVKGILSLDEGRFFDNILCELRQCGYELYPKLFNMKNYGIPQNRERVIILGIRNDIEVKFVWPEEIRERTLTLREAIGDLPLEYDESIQHVGSLNKVRVNGYVGGRVLDWDKVSPTIIGGRKGGGFISPIHPSQERRLTVREVARIQTFPDDFTFSGSMTSMYRQLGNAVPPKFSLTLSSTVLNLFT